jgi:hypothetical protein
MVARIISANEWDPELLPIFYIVMSLKKSNYFFVLNYYILHFVLGGPIHGSLIYSNTSTIVSARWKGFHFFLNEKWIKTTRYDRQSLVSTKEILQLLTCDTVEVGMVESALPEYPGVSPAIFDVITCDPRLPMTITRSA